MTDLEPADLASARAHEGAAAGGAVLLVGGKPITALKLGMLSLLAKAGRPALKSAAIAELARRAEAASKAEIGPSSDISSAAGNDVTNEKHKDLAETSSDAAANFSPNQAKSRRSKRSDHAVDWLREALAEGPVLAGDLKRQGVAAGFTKRTLERAAARIGVKRERPTFGGSYCWSLPLLASNAFGEHGVVKPRGGMVEEAIAP